MSNNVLKLKKKYTNVLNLHDAYVVPHARTNVVDLRKRRESKKELQPKEKETKTSETNLYAPGINYFLYVSKTIAIVLVIALNTITLSSIGFTFSAFTDEELSEGNLFESGLLDFTLELSPFNNMAWAGLTVGTSTAQDIDVLPHLLSNPFFYYASSTNFHGDLDFCDAINVEATLGGPTLYSGPLTGLLSASTTVLNAWNLEFSTDEEFVNAVCHFDIDFNGWQTRHDYPEYNNGFSDTEKTSHWLHSPGIVINKVYFEEKDCDKKGGHHYGYGGGGKGDCDEEEEEPKVTICHATESEVHPWQRIVVSENAIGGHFENNGTPLAGHEEDLLLLGDVECPLPPDDGEDDDGRRDRRERDIVIINDNEATTTNEVASDANTGGNNVDGGDGAEGGDGGDGGGDGGDGGDGADGGTIETGDATSTVEVENIINQNTFDFGFGKKLKDTEWVELYNQTGIPALVDGWFICDAHECDELVTPESIPPNGFALIIPDEKVLSEWEVPEDFVIILIEDGTIGDGLDNERDALFLKRPDSETIDQLNWGDPNPAWPHYDDSLWVPGVTPPPLGSMLGRVPTGFDTNEPSDWQTITPPNISLLSPGYVVSLPWFWDHTYIVTWEAESCSDDEEPLIDIILIRDTNYNGKIDDEDERIVLAYGLENDGEEEIMIPEGFIGKVWLRLVASCSINPMAQDFDTSGKAYCSFPSFYLDNENNKGKAMDAIYAQIEGQGASEYSSLLPDPDPEPELEEIIPDETGSTTPQLLEEENSTTTEERRERREREDRGEEVTSTSTEEVIVEKEETQLEEADQEDPASNGAGEVPPAEDDTPPPDEEPVIKEEELIATSTEETLLEE